MAKRHYRKTRRPFVERLENRILLYAQTAANPAHQWITKQGYDFFEFQFGESEISQHLGTVRAYPATDHRNENDLFIEGVFDEDELLENPFGQGDFVPTPSLRHFWAHDDEFNREFDLGFRVGTDILTIDDVLKINPFDFVDVAFDSAANRAVKYLTGGYGLTAQSDGRIVFGSQVVGVESNPAAFGVWGEGSGPANSAKLGEGAIGFYQQARALEASGQTLAAATKKGNAYYFLGHAAHLLQDMTLPAHSHADPHLELNLPGRFAGIDPDPFHDYADGIEFIAGLPGPKSAVAIGAFSDDNTGRFLRWGFDPNMGGVGPIGLLPSDFLTDRLRTAEELNDLPVPLPAFPTTEVVPIYKLFYATADRSDDFDAKDVNGQVDNGNRGSCDSILTCDGVFKYNNWTKAELDEIANDMMPLAMQGTAELIRVFYGIIDEQPPELTFNHLVSSDPDNPQAIPETNSIDIEVEATDEKQGDTGVGFFTLQVQERPKGGEFSEWRDLEITEVERKRRTATVKATFQVLEPGVTYGFRLFAEDGAGNRVGPGPDEAAPPTAYVRIGGASAVEVIDVSDSVKDALPAIQAAAKLFNAQLREDDRVGIVSFNTAGTTSFPLSAVSSTGQDAREGADTAIDGLTTGKSTSIGAGIAAADRELAKQPTDPHRGIVLLSDGHQNTTPTAISAARALDPNILIYTIGFGKDVDSRLLTDIARQGNGEFFSAGEADLSNIYTKIARKMSGEKANQEGEGEIAAGEIRATQVTVDRAIERVTFGLQWPKETLRLELVDLSGMVIDRRTAAGRTNTRTLNGSLYDYVTVVDPLPGEWQVRVRSDQQAGNAQPYHLAVTTASSIVAEQDIDRFGYDVDETVPIRVRVTEDDVPSLGATVIATISPPEGSSYASAHATLYDDGQHDDDAAGDGIYANDFRGGSVAGVYQLEIEAKGRSSDDFAFSRRSDLTLVVSGGSAAPITESGEFQDEFVYTTHPAMGHSFDAFDVAFDWHNKVDPADVNEDHVRSPLDALAVINYLNRHGSRPLPPRRDGSAKIDANNDGFSIAFDVLVLINELERERRTDRVEGEWGALTFPSPEVRESNLSDSAEVNRDKDSVFDNPAVAWQAERPISEQVRPTSSAADNSTNPDLELALAEIAEDLSLTWW